jgi:hypothetical protein
MTPSILHTAITTRTAAALRPRWHDQHIIAATARQVDTIADTARSNLTAPGARDRETMAERQPSGAA